MRKMFVIPALIAASGFMPLLGVGTAASQTPVPAVITGTPAGWLGADEIARQLTAAGWTVLEIEAEPTDANYKACVTSAGGALIEARVNPVTGAIQSQEPKDCLGGGLMAPANLNFIGGYDSGDSDSDDSDDHSGDSRSD